MTDARKWMHLLKSDSNSSTLWTLRTTQKQYNHINIGNKNRNSCSPPPPPHKFWDIGRRCTRRQIWDLGVFGRLLLTSWYGFGRDWTLCQQKVHQGLHFTRIRLLYLQPFGNISRGSLGVWISFGGGEGRGKIGVESHANGRCTNDFCHNTCEYKKRKKK